MNPQALPTNWPSMIYRIDPVKGCWIATPRWFPIPWIRAKVAELVNGPPGECRWSLDCVHPLHRSRP